jgi:hypothetical protein
VGAQDGLGGSKAERVGDSLGSPISEQQGHADAGEIWRAETDFYVKGFRPMNKPTSAPHADHAVVHRARELRDLSSRLAVAQR